MSRFFAAEDGVGVIAEEFVASLYVADTVPNPDVWRIVAVYLDGGNLVDITLKGTYASQAAALETLAKLVAVVDPSEL